MKDFAYVAVQSACVAPVLCILIGACLPIYVSPSDM